MLDKKTFCSLMESLEEYNNGVSALEVVLNTKFDSNFLTSHIDKMLITLAESFVESDTSMMSEIARETVADIIFHYAMTCEFGLHTNKLKRLYIEDEGLETEQAFDATTTAELYDLIIRYLTPTEVRQTYILYC